MPLGKPEPPDLVVMQSHSGTDYHQPMSQHSDISGSACPEYPLSQHRYLACPALGLQIDQGVGSTSGIRACALRYFDLGKMELENSQNNSLAKLPILKLGEYEMWEIRIKQYFQIQDYALWEVIENGNSWVPIPVTAPDSGPSTALKMTVPSTTEEKICKKNDVKARSLLLMALPNEHQLTFNQYADAQSMFIAIKARFGGNDATKKTQKALLKQQYENFNATSSESLDSIFNRLQKLVSRLAILGVDTPAEDLNVKFLRSLPSEWDTHVVVWMNKPDFETMGLDDLYNNFKIVEQKLVLATPRVLQLVHEDLEQIHDDDLEEMDLKWNMALLSMRARKFYQRTRRKIIIDGSSTAGYDKSKVECFNCHKMGHFARECRAPRSKDNRNWNQGSSSKAVRIEDASEKAMCAIDGAGFDWSDMAEDEIQANMALMTFTDSEDQPPLELYCQSQIILRRITDVSLTTTTQAVTETRICCVLLAVDKDWKEKFFHPANHVRVEEPKKARENTDAPIIEDWVSDDEEEVESIPKEEKKADVPIATKKESVKTVNPSRRLVRSVNTVRHFSTAKFINTVRPNNTAHPKPTVSCARPKTYFQNQAQRPFYKHTELIKRPNVQNINTSRQTVNTVRPNVNTVRARGFNVVKPSACWVWRPIKPNGASLSNSQLNEKGFVDSGCSRHMSGNIASVFQIS
ncbi:ribonuclease H-like domain-containing protein [Tanacetum coccineum]|uniref:Ribonuclease H-like domain-containing protein n=1 Tax=Tanacetum coccineum TaxID=301880 RepID=A0ABQ5CT32_9ASTR